MGHCNVDIVVDFLKKCPPLNSDDGSLGQYVPSSCETDRSDVGMSCYKLCPEWYNLDSPSPKIVCEQNGQWSGDLTFNCLRTFISNWLRYSLTLILTY